MQGNNIIKENSNFFQLLNGNEFLLLDTETTGIDENLNSLIQYASLKIKLKKDLIIKEKDNNLKLILNNKYIKNINFVEKISNKEYILSNNQKLIIENNIPILYDGKKYKMIFSSVGDFEIKEEFLKEFNYKLTDNMNPHAMFVHKMYNKERLKKELNSENIKDFIKVIKEKELKKLESLLKKENSYIKLLDDKEIKNEIQEKINSLEYKIKLLNKLKLPRKKNLEKKEFEKLLEDFLDLLNKLNYKELKNNITFNQDIEVQKKIEKDLNNNIISGHNVFNFDIQKFILNNSNINLKNYNIIDTMYFYMENFKIKKSPSLDKLVEKGIKNKLDFFKKEIYEPFLKNISIINKKNKNIVSKEIKELEGLIKNGILKGIYTPILFNKIENLINNIEDKLNIEDNFNILKVLKDLEEVLKLKEEREFLHDALLDIKLNLFAYDTLIEEYIEKYELKDINEQNKRIYEIDKIKEDINKLEIPYIGLNTAFTKETKTTNKDILKFCQEHNINNISISDEIFTNYYNDYNLFKDNNINNYLSLKLKINNLNIEHNGVNLIFQDKKSYENAKLLFDNYTITQEELYFLLNKLNIVVYIHPSADKYLKHNKIYIKVSPNIMYDYKQSFQNKRSLWIGNRYTLNNPNEKVEHYIYTRFLKNEIINPIKIFDIYKNPDKYPNIGIPTKEELLKYFPYEDFKDIYENANNIINNTEVIDPEPKQIDLFPSIERILKLKKELKTPEEYKDLLLEKLQKEYKNKNFKISIKRLVLKKWKQNILNLIMNKRNMENPNYKELNEIEQFIYNIGPVDSLPLKDFENYNFSEMPFWNKLKNEKLKKKLQENLEKESNTKFKIIKDRVNYELEALVKFKNYKIVFTYYFLISDILEVLDKNGMPHGPGRGSAAGSIISFLLGVTKLDPTEYDLLFERFLNPERVSLPDVDVDLPYDDFLTKDKVIEILEEHYKMSKEELEILFKDNLYDKEIVEKAENKGHFKYTSKIITTSEITDKVAVKNTFRLLGMPFSRLNEASKEWNDEESIKNNLKNNKIFKYEYNYIVDFLLKNNTLENIEGLISNFGRHAGGVRIPNSPIQAEEPATNDSTSTDKKNPRNEAKMDLLGLVTVLALTNMEERLSIDKNKNKQLLIDDKMFVFDDSKVYKNIRNGLTASVFQVENPKLSELLSKLVVDDFETLIAAVALYRPGPIQTGDVDKYVIYRLNQLKENLKWIYNILKKEGKITNDYNNLNEEDIKIFYNYYNSLYPNEYKYQDIFNILTVKEYYETNEFQQKLDNKLLLIEEFIKNNSNYKKMSEEEILNEINKNLPEKEHKQELETIEKLYLKNTNTYKNEVIKWEKEIANDPDYKEITSGTNGVIVYQEQIMKLSRVAGFTKGESDALRKVVAKSQKDKIKQFRTPILEGLQKDRILKLEFEYNGKKYLLQRNYEYDYEIILPNGKNILIYNPEIKLDKNNLKIIFNEKSLEDINKQLIGTSYENQKVLNYTDIKIIDKKIQQGMSKNATEYLFDSIVGFGSYAFNKSHAAAYATLTYKTALFKTYVPEIFYAEMLKLSSTKSIQELIREIHTRPLIDKNNKEYFIKLEIKNINNINSDFTIDDKEHIVYLPPSIIKSVKEETISLIELEMSKTKKKYSNIINIIRRVPKFDKATFRQLGIAGLYKKMDTKNGLNEMFFDKYGDLLFSTLKKWNEEQLFKDLNNEEKKEIREYLKLRETLLLNELYTKQLKEYNDRLENIIEQQGYEEEVNNININIEKLENKIKEITIEEKEKYKELYRKYNDLINKKYLNETIKEIPEEVFQKMKENLTNEELLNFEKIKNNELNYTEEEKSLLKHSIFKEFYFHENKIKLKTKNQLEIKKLLAEEYKISDEVDKLSPNYEVFVGKTPKIAIIFDKPNNNYKVNKIKVNDKILEVNEYNQVIKDNKRYSLNIQNKKLVGPLKDGEYNIEGKKIIITNKSFDKEGNVIPYTEIIIDGEKYKYDKKRNVFINKKDPKKEIKNTEIGFIEENIEEIYMKNEAEEIAEKYAKEIFEGKYSKEDFVIFHYKTREGNLLNIEKILKEMNLSVTMITGIDLIKEVKKLSPIFSKISENNTAYNIQTYPYGYTNILFFNNILSKYNQLNSKKLKSLEKKKIEQEINKIKNELKQGTSNFILPENLQGSLTME